MADVSKLSEYLAAVAARRWQPGEMDCGIFMADWAERLGLRDPIADLRGTYYSERGFMRIIRREGGLVKSAETRLERCGMRETLTPRPGDLAIVLAAYAARRGTIQRRPTGAIFVDHARRAVVTTDIGLVIATEKELPLVRVWTI